MIKLKVTLVNLSEGELTKLILATNQLDKGPYDVYFSDKKTPKSLPQLRYLWGVCYKALADKTGYHIEEIHEMCKVKFSLRMRYDLPNHEVIEYPTSLKLMDTRQMTEYIDRIRQWSNESLGVYIPQPHEITDEHYIESFNTKL